MKRTNKEYFEATKEVPIQDDLARANCKEAGKPGHFACGWCNKHDTPIHICGCWAK